MARSLYTLMASLPHLVYFERAKQLPISEIQLEKRIGTLLPEMRELTLKLGGFLSWHYHPSSMTNAKLAAEYREVMALCAPYPGIARLIEETMCQRTIVAALRLKASGIGLDEVDADWGVGACKRHIVRYWHEKDFRLALRYPWMQDVKRCLASEEPFEMERLFIRLIWRRCTELRFAEPFGFDALIAYLFQWGLTQKWLGYDEQKAANRFAIITSEVVSGHKHEHPLFG